jgi:hypothetical protein
MGAYLYFKTNPDSAEKANAFLAEQPEFKKLEKIYRNIWFTSTEDVEWARKNRPESVDYYYHELGKGAWKASGIDENEGEPVGLSYEDIFEHITMLFERLNNVVEMKYLVNSCALNPNEYYFSLDQMRRITDHGRLLSSTPKESRQKLIDFINKDD